MRKVGRELYDVAHIHSRSSAATFPGWVLGGILSRFLIATSLFVQPFAWQR